MFLLYKQINAMCKKKKSANDSAKLGHMCVHTFFSLFVIIKILLAFCASFVPAGLQNTDGSF